jgi:methylmalonyl-CoA/ethylmalonyl-CoA epimerase
VSGEGVRLRLDHVGIAVPDLEEARERYRRLLGVEPSPVEEVPGEKVRLSFFDLGGCRLELLEGTGPESPIRKFLDSGRTGVHHLSVNVEGGDIGRLLSEIEGRGVEALAAAGGERLRPGAGGSRIFFVHPRAAAGVLIEFRQEGKTEER